MMPRVQAYDRLDAQAEPVCDACGQPLETVEEEAGRCVLRNELCLVLGGGYGSFIDPGPPGRVEYSYIFCEACAVRLCRLFGLRAPLREHHTSTVCHCPDRPPRDERGFPRPCRCPVCAS